MENEAKETIEEVRASSESVIDAALDAFDGAEENATDPSSEEQPAVEEAREAEDTGSDQQKPEESEAESEELPKEFHKHPKWQKLLQRAKDAEAKLEERGENQGDLSQVQQILNSPAYIRASMETQGYTQEAINNALRDKGYKVNTPEQNDLDYVLSKLNVDMNNLDDESKQYINTNVADAITVFKLLNEKYGNTQLDQKLAPIEERLTEVTAEREGKKTLSSIEKMVKEEGVLDYKQDVEPIVNDWLDKNADNGTLEDLQNFVSTETRKLTIERLRGQGRADERAEKKKGLKKGEPSNAVISGEAPKFDGSDKSLEKLLDHYGVR